jgi:hypothetical protein
MPFHAREEPDNQYIAVCRGPHGNTDEPAHVRHHVEHPDAFQAYRDPERRLRDQTFSESGAAC